MKLVTATNAPDAFREVLWALKLGGIEEDSRNGTVITLPHPLCLEVTKPTQRVLFDPVRDANPFFHLLETVWMFAGSNDVRFLEGILPKYRNYADVNTNVVHGAYGWRWRGHFQVDQIHEAIELLNKDKNTRRAVINMWDPLKDLNTEHNDLPCNTQILLRVGDRELDFTVINRSNDVIWGMLGANIVHMTYLHELIASAIGLAVGTYRVFSNNAHIYKDLPKREDMMDFPISENSYVTQGVYPSPLLLPNESYKDLLIDCCMFVGSTRSRKDQVIYKTKWMQETILWVWVAYEHYKLGDIDGALAFARKIEAQDWRLACIDWLNRRIKWVIK